MARHILLPDGSLRLLSLSSRRACSNPSSPYVYPDIGSASTMCAKCYLAASSSSSLLVRAASSSRLVRAASSSRRVRDPSSLRRLVSDPSSSRFPAADCQSASASGWLPLAAVAALGNCIGGALVAHAGLMGSRALVHTMPHNYPTPPPWFKELQMLRKLPAKEIWLSLYESICVKALEYLWMTPGFIYVTLKEVIEAKLKLWILVSVPSVATYLLGRDVSKTHGQAEKLDEDLESFRLKLAENLESFRHNVVQDLKEEFANVLSNHQDWIMQLEASLVKKMDAANTGGKAKEKAPADVQSSAAGKMTAPDAVVQSSAAGKTTEKAPKSDPATACKDAY